MKILIAVAVFVVVTGVWWYNSPQGRRARFELVQERGVHTNFLNVE